MYTASRIRGGRSILLLKVLTHCHMVASCAKEERYVILCTYNTDRLFSTVWHYQISYGLNTMGTLMIKNLIPSSHNIPICCVHNLLCTLMILITVYLLLHMLSNAGSTGNTHTVELKILTRVKFHQGQLLLYCRKISWILFSPAW